MSADDATARWLDEQVDLALTTGGAMPPELADSELGEVVQLFAADAAALATERMADASGVRRRILEQVGDEQQAASGAGVVGSLVRGTVRGTGRGAGLGARGAGWSAGRLWRVRRVAMVAGCVIVLCTTLAYADTRTPAGRVVRTAARQLQLPVPNEPRQAGERRADADARARKGAQRDERPRGAAPGDPDVAREPGVIVPGEMRDPLPGDEQFLPDGDHLFDDGAPRPSGELEPKPPQQQLPPPDGTMEPKPYPDGSAPPPDGQPKPIGQQPPPPGGTAPAPCCIQQPAPKPGGTAPAPGTPLPPPPAPAPAPAPQPQPAPLPAPLP